MSRKALIFGINHYDYLSSLKGCINDARKVKSVLTHHCNNEDMEINFHVDIHTSDGDKTLTRDFLRAKIAELFRDPREISLLYCASHGYTHNGQGYLVTSECERGHQGLSMNDILQMVIESPATHRIIVLDCCHAGSFGVDFLGGHLTRMNEGMTIIVGSASNQYASEVSGAGVFTDLFCHALEGGAASILGEITPGSIYGYIDKAMGEKGQRPMFITKVRRYSVLRKIQSQIGKPILRKITQIFPNPDEPLQLDRSF